MATIQRIRYKLSHIIRSTKTVVTANTKTFYTTTIAYLILYLYVIGDLRFTGGNYSIRIADTTLMFKQISPFYFEGLAVISTPFITLILSPLNLFIGGLIAALVGINIAFSITGFRHPQECSTNNATGLLSVVPALLGGSACCGPILIFVLGLQASSTLLTFFGILIPLALLLLILTAIYSSLQIDIDALRRATS